MLLGGYYFPAPRLDTLLVAPAAVPVLGDVLRYTVSPVFGWLTMPPMKRAMFAPVERAVEARVLHRPGAAAVALRATTTDGALMMSDAKELSARYGALAMPVAIVAGNGDKVVSPDHAERLRKTVPEGTHGSWRRRAHGPTRRHAEGGGRH